MRRVRSTTRAAIAIVIGTLLAGGGLAPALFAAGPDKAEVVLVLDFSASILDDAASRNRFGAALERIAARVDETSRDLITGDATVSIVRFASRAADLQGCTELKLIGSPATVGKFADCLRSVAGAYRAGLQPALTTAIGNDTNYVAAMEAAAKHLPADAVRPALILFSDGKHDVAGVPVSQVAPARDRLFGDRSPFALLPVGMGLDPAARGELEAGLVGLRTIREMPACATGSAFEWPQVVFETADEAGNAVAVALQNATCTFTVAPTAPPSAPPAAAVQNIGLKPLDGRIEVTWSAPTRVTEQIVDYLVRCTAEGEDPIESTEGVSTERAATVEGLTNGKAYRCEVAAVTESAEGEFTAAAASATPSGRPGAPGKPTVVALDSAVRIAVTPADGSAATGFHYQCSADNGATWPGEADAASAADTTAQVGSLANGVNYVCRAFAMNDSGTSDASPLSDVVRPCSTFLQCNALALPLLGGIGGVLAGALLLGLFFLIRSRRGGYVVAVVDVVHSANMGNRSSFGIELVKGTSGRGVEGIARAKGSKADVRVKKLRGDRFRVKDKEGTRTVPSGEPLVVVDAVGVHHELVLRAFTGKAASSVSVRR